MSDFWVFGYGSLIWRPGFEFVEESKALLFGRRRALCIYSWVHRGTRENPGLVLGLDSGGSCHGVARRVEGRLRDRVVAYLREREMVTDVYHEVWVPIRLEDGRKVDALTYVVNRQSPQYTGPISSGEIVSLVAHASGKSGVNRDYVESTVASLKAWDIRDHSLEHICKEMERL